MLRFQIKHFLVKKVLTKISRHYFFLFLLFLLHGEALPSPCSIFANLLPHRSGAYGVQRKDVFVRDPFTWPFLCELHPHSTFPNEFEGVVQKAQIGDGLKVAALMSASLPKIFL